MNEALKSGQKQVVETQKSLQPLWSLKVGWLVESGRRFLGSTTFAATLCNTTEKAGFIFNHFSNHLGWFLAPKTWVVGRSLSLRGENADQFPTTYANQRGRNG